MSNPLRTPLSAVPICVGLVVVAVGVVTTFTDHRMVGFALLVLGLVVEFGGVWLHDRRHRRRGETTHAMWGSNDRNRPRWPPGGRRGLHQ